MGDNCKRCKGLGVEVIAVEKGGILIYGKCLSCSLAQVLENLFDSTPQAERQKGEKTDTRS